MFFVVKNREFPWNGELKKLEYKVEFLLKRGDNGIRGKDDTEEVGLIVTSAYTVAYEIQGSGINL